MTDNALTPQERLAMTRRALVLQMTNGRRETADAPDRSSVGPGRAYADAEASGASGLTGVWRTVSLAAKAWWRAHPARLALEVAEPIAGKYAQANPIKFLAAAAGLGAFIVLAKPWRLISVTGLLVAAVKSTQVTSLVSSLLSQDHDPRDDVHP